VVGFGLRLTFARLVEVTAVLPLVVRVVVVAFLAAMRDKKVKLVWVRKSKTKNEWQEVGDMKQVDRETKQAGGDKPNLYRSFFAGLYIHLSANPPGRLEVNFCFDRVAPPPMREKIAYR
jgi:hypothetical protein